MKRGNKRDFINEIYMKRDKYLKPKENFSTLIKLIAKDKPKSNFTLLDVGRLKQKSIIFSLTNGTLTSTPCAIESRSYCAKWFDILPYITSSNNFELYGFKKLLNKFLNIFF